MKTKDRLFIIVCLIISPGGFWVLGIWFLKNCTLKIKIWRRLCLKLTKKAQK